jgi:hypothetical protein
MPTQRTASKCFAATDNSLLHLFEPAEQQQHNITNFCVSIILVCVIVMLLTVA